jgi:hypothetical protein
MVETAAVLNVSRAEIFRSGNTAALETVVELDEENGGGYMGTLEIFHQLHCLVSSGQPKSFVGLMKVSADTVSRTFCGNGLTGTTMSILIPSSKLGQTIAESTQTIV